MNLESWLNLLHSLVVLVVDDAHRGGNETGWLWAGMGAGQWVNWQLDTVVCIFRIFFLQIVIDINALHCTDFPFCTRVKATLSYKK